MIRITKSRRFEFFPSRIIAFVLVAAVFGACSPEARKARHLARADADFKEGKFEEAKIEYLRVLREDQKNAAAYRQLGLIWSQQGAPIQAISFLTRARDLAPENLEVRLALANDFAALGALADARKEALEVLRRDPRNGEALLILPQTVSVKQGQEEVEAAITSFPDHNAPAYLVVDAILQVRKGNDDAAKKDLEAALAADPKSARVHVAIGDLSLRQKDSARAKTEFAAAADLAPTRSSFRVQYAKYLAETGALDDAKKYLAGMLVQTPDYLPAANLQAQLAFDERKYDDAQAAAQNVLQRDPSNLDALMLRARLFLAKGETAKGVDALEHLATAYSGFAAIKYQLARAYLQNNDPDQAARMLTEAITANPDYVEPALLLAEVNLRTGKAQVVSDAMVDLLRKHPEQAQAQLLLAASYRALGQFDNAAAVFRAQIAESPKNPQPYFLLGMVLREQKKAAEARAQFTKAQELAPGDLSVTYQLVDLDIQDKNYDGALKRVAALEKPDSPGAKILKGRIYAAQKDWDHAIEAFRAALDADPDSNSAYQSLIAAYVGSQKLPEAIAQTEAQLSKKPNDFRTLMIAAVLYSNGNEPEKARDAFEKVLTIKPDFAPAMNDLAYLYGTKLNDVDKAIELARKSRSIQPDDPRVTDTLGWLLFKKGDYPHAFPLLQEVATGKLASMPEVQYHFGMASYMMGQTEVARAALRKAEDSPTDFPGKSEIKSRLALLGEGSAGSVSRADLEAMVKERPNDVQAWTLLGEALEKEGTPEKAAPAYEKALELNSNLLPVTLKLAQIEAGPLHNLEKAMTLGKRARELAPTDPHVAEVVGGIAFRHGDYPMAYNLLGDSVAQSKNASSALLSDLAWATYSLGKVNQARQTMNRALEAGPDAATEQQSKSFLALTAVEPKDLAATESKAQDVLKAEPKNVPALMVVADAHNQRGDKAGAAALYASILAQYPDFAPAEIQLATIEADEPATRGKAYDLAMKAHKALPDDPHVTQLLGELSFERKEYPFAIQLLKSSASGLAPDAKALYCLGMSLWLTKDKVASRDPLQHAIDAGLQEPLLAEAKRVLAESEKK